MDAYAKKTMLHWLKYDLRAVDEPKWSLLGGINFPLWYRSHRGSAERPSTNY
jgi:hypothetical protein